MSNTVSNPSGTSTSVPLTLTLNPTPSLVARDENTIRAAILTTLQADFAQSGITVNVLPGSDYYRLATAFARQLAVGEANDVVQVDNYMPDSTQDIVVLARYMALVGPSPGLSPRSAFGSFGPVTITSSQPSPITGSTIPGDGAQLVDSLNQLYQVTQGGTYASGTTVFIQALSTGSQTNHVNGDVLTWVVAPPFCSPTVTVGTLGAQDGLTNGGDAEDIETARARYMGAVANPMGGGNSAQVAATGAQANGAICGVCVYPAANGASTCHVACFGYATNLAASNAKNRDLPATLMNGTVIPFIGGKMAEYAELVITTVTNAPTDVSVGMTLPASPSANPPGPGGGWIDAVPWPANINSVSNFYCDVTVVTSTTVITCNAPGPPIAGVSSIAYLDPLTWTLFTAHVVSYTGSAGAYVLTLDSPLVNVAVGGFIFPLAQNTQTYVNAFLGAFAAMGPGEKTAAAGLLPRASRKPAPQTAFPYSLNNLFLKAITNSGPEVIAASFLYTSQTTPALPSSIGLAPGLLTPRNMGLYPA